MDLSARHPGKLASFISATLSWGVAEHETTAEKRHQKLLENAVFATGCAQVTYVNTVFSVIVCSDL
jgi:hypothetical protein